MKVFAGVSGLLTLIGVLKVDHAKANLLSTLHRIFTLAAIVVYICAYACHLLFGSETFAESLTTCGIIAALLYTASSYCIFVGRQGAFMDMIDTIRTSTRQRSQQSKTFYFQCFANIRPSIPGVCNYYYNKYLSTNAGEAAAAIYEAASEDLEYLTRTGQRIVFRYMVPLHVVPLALKSYFRYYVMGMGAAAIELPFPNSLVLLVLLGTRPVGCLPKEGAKYFGQANKFG